MENLNGSLALDEVRSLRQKVELIDARLQELNNETQMLTQQRRRLNAAVVALTSVPKKKVRAPQQHRVSAERKEKVFTVLAKANGKGLSAAEIVKRSGLKTDAVRAAIVSLREEDRVRDQGKAPRTPDTKGISPHLYAVMEV